MNNHQSANPVGKPSVQFSTFRFRSLTAVVLTAAAWTSACASPSPAVTAANVERLQCDLGSNETHLAELLNQATILQVGPHYSTISAKNNLEERRAGVKILMRPPEGISADRMTRILQCHSARVLLGQIDRPEPSKDPFSLRDALVNIDVKPQDGNYVVTLETDKTADNIQLTALAASFAQAHGVSTGGLE
jgi:hypothetical protein